MFRRRPLRGFRSGTVTERPIRPARPGSAHGGDTTILHETLSNRPSLRLDAFTLATDLLSRPGSRGEGQ
ncbi:hypothetical protein F8B43_2201 [Methylorubrum populi]|uniref:Uncharacterized protein n=1 Tax=Methylorubrum populi TaxID=223967 RepID=A0A833MZT2_9HYPH|nr:hypothetical protein F8B43_2201 [Methylorubrum populi]